MEKRLPIIFLVLVVSASLLQAQLVEVEDFSNHNFNNIQQIANRILLSDWDGNRFITHDFDTYTPAVGKDAYLGHFVLDEQTYFITREPYAANPQYILRLTESLAYDTIVTYSGNALSSFSLLATSQSQAYYLLSGSLFRFNLLDSSVSKFSVSNYPNLSTDPRIHLVTDTALFLFSDKIGRINLTDQTIKQGKIKLNDDYNNLVIHTTFRVPNGILITFTDTADNTNYSALTNGDSVYHINKIPSWPDSSFSSVSEDPFNALRQQQYFYSIYNQLVYENERFHYIYQCRSNTPQVANRQWQWRWYSFDTASYSLKLTQDTHISHHIQEENYVFKLNGGTTAFSMHKNHGFELVKLTPDSIQLIKDIFPNMASGIEMDWQGPAYRQDGGTLYFLATDPYFGISLFKTDGTPKGTGNLGSVGERLSRGYSKNQKIFVSKTDVFVYREFYDKRLVFKVKKSSAFLVPKYLAQNEIWNQSIYTTLYDRYYGSSLGLLRSRMRYRDGLVLSTTSGDSQAWRHFPEANVSLPYLDYLKGPAYTFGIYSANGSLKLGGMVQTSSGYARFALGKDSVLHAFYKHKNESFTSFDTVRISGEFNLIRTYDLQGNFIWNLKLPQNFNSTDIITDNAGNIFISGFYTGRQLKFNSDIELTSLYSRQNFIAKISPNGEVLWANNLDMQGYGSASYLQTLYFDENSQRVYCLISEGFYNVWSSCKYQSWLNRVHKLDAGNGTQIWQHDLPTTDFAELYGITVSATGDVWVAGKFRGELFQDGQYVAIAKGSDCPTNGILVCLDGNNGGYKRSITSETNAYGALTANKNGMYTVSYSLERTIEVSNDAPRKYLELRIEKRDIGGNIKAVYSSPVNYHSLDKPLFDIHVLDNEDEDWFYYSSSVSGQWPISDSLYISGVSMADGYGNAFLMRRPGSIFKTIEEESPIGWQGEKYAVYPNPSRFNEVFVSAITGAELFTSYQLIALDGRIVAEGRVEQAQWPIYIRFNTDLRGLYILRMSGPVENKSFKIVFE